MRRWIDRSWVLALALSCGGHPPQLAAEAETIVIRDGATYRTERDGSVTVNVQVTAGDRAAGGSVRLPGGLVQVFGSKHLRFARARAWQVLGAELSGRAAFDVLVRGIHELDGTYAIRNLDDDTGMYTRLYEQRVTEAPDQLPYFVDRLRGILRTRLRLYQRAWWAELR